MLPSRAFTAYDESTFGRSLPAASARRRPGFLVRRDREVDDDDLSHGALVMGVSGDLLTASGQGRASSVYWLRVPRQMASERS